MWGQTHDTSHPEYYLAMPGTETRKSPSQDPRVLPFHTWIDPLEYVQHQNLNALLSKAFRGQIL